VGAGTTLCKSSLYWLPPALWSGWLHRPPPLRWGAAVFLVVVPPIAIPKAMREDALLGYAYPGDTHAPPVIARWPAVLFRSEVGEIPIAVPETLREAGLPGLLAGHYRGRRPFSTQWAAVLFCGRAVRKRFFSITQLLVPTTGAQNFRLNGLLFVLRCNCPVGAIKVIL